MSPEHAANHPELAQAWHTGHTGTLWQFIVSPKKKIKMTNKKELCISLSLESFWYWSKPKPKDSKVQTPKTPPKIQYFRNQKTQNLDLDYFIDFSTKKHQ